MDDNQAMYQATMTKLGEEIQASLMLRAKMAQMQNEIDNLKKEQKKDKADA